MHATNSKIPPFGTAAGDATALTDIGVQRYSQNGQLLWSTAIPALSISGLCSFPDGSAYAAGVFTDDIEINSETFHADESDSLVVKLKTAGGFQWIQQLSGSGDQNVCCLAAKSSGEVILAGGFQATTTFPPFTLTSAADTDAFVAMLGSTNANPMPSLSLKLYPGLSIDGLAGIHYRIEYSDSLSTSWHTLTNVTSESSPFLWFDISSPSPSRRFYRVTVAP
jgi:hypothetical protein